MASKDVYLVSGGYDGVIRYWDTSGGHAKKTLEYKDSQDAKTKYPVFSLDFSNDGHYLAACSVKSFRIYETDSDKQAPKYVKQEAHKAAINKIGFNYDAKWIYTAGNDKQCKIWDMRTAVCVHTVEARGMINGCLLHPNQTEIVMVDESGFVRVWNISTGTFRLEMCPDDNTPLHCMTISPDGESLIACSKKGNVYIWKYSSTAIQPRLKFHAHDEYVLSCKVSMTNKTLATTSADRSIKLWDLDTMEVTKLIGHEGYVWDSTFSCDSKNLVSCSSDHTCRLWDLRSGRVIRHYTGHEKTVACLALYERFCSV